MGKYVVSAGQNIYDVALHIYGSIEGIVDLMMNNTELSLSDTLKMGDELMFSDDYVINKDIVAHMKTHGITPSNGERSVYHKSTDQVKMVEFYLHNQTTIAEFTLSGKGEVLIDWGDNSTMEEIVFTEHTQTITHFFDNQIAEQRKVCVYGYFSVRECNLSSLNALAIYPIQPIYTEKLTLHNGHLNIDFLSMTDGIYKADLTNIKTSSLLPLLSCKYLMELNLTGAVIDQPILDEYLVGLVKQYNGRRNCHITLSLTPSGNFREPSKDENGNYVIKSGMEAIWILVNEPAWNEAGNWVFDVKGVVYGG